MFFHSKRMLVIFRSLIIIIINFGRWKASLRIPILHSRVKSRHYLWGCEYYVEVDYLPSARSIVSQTMAEIARCWCEKDAEYWYSFLSQSILETHVWICWVQSRSFLRRFENEIRSTSSELNFRSEKTNFRAGENFESAFFYLYRSLAVYHLTVTVVIAIKRW